MTKAYGTFFLLGLFLMFHASLQAQSLDGVWHSSENGYEEHLGAFELLSELSIEDGKYTLMRERISERSMYWSTGERGSIRTGNSEIVFSKEEQAYGQWDLRWEKEEETIIYTFFKKDNILILIQGDTVIVFRKEQGHSARI
jgi:hypothetical protein